MSKTSMALLLLASSNTSLGFAPVRMPTKINSIATCMTPKIRLTPLFYSNPTEPETIGDKAEEDELLVHLTSAPSKDAAANVLEAEGKENKPIFDDPSVEADILVVQFNDVAYQDADADVLEDETEDKEEEITDADILDQVMTTDSKHIYRDKTMNVISSERKLNTWLHNQHLDSSDGFYPEGLPVDVIMERIGDTLEDVALHMRRMGYEENGKKQMLSPEEEQSRKTVVVLGSGWGAHALMKVADCKKLRLVVVSPVNHFVFTPMLASSAVGTVEYRSMTEAVRSANPLIDEYLQGKAVGVDVHKKTVQVQLNSLLGDIQKGNPPLLEVPYDHLVCSVGCKVNDWGVPGADKALRLKTLDDARILRRDIAECFEYASRPDVAGEEQIEERTRRATVLIVGGGPTGVELAGEILDLAEDVTKVKGSYPHLKDNIRVVIAQGGPDLVPQFEPRLRQEAKKSLEAKGAEVLTNTRVTEVGDGFAKLTTKPFDDNGRVVGGEEFTLPLGLTVWCAGTAPVSFVDTLLQQLPPEARSRDGRVNVDKWLRPPMPSEDLTGSLFVLGDAAAFADQGFGSVADSPLPQTAQVAGQQGAFLARLLDRGYNISSTPPEFPAESDSNAADVFNDPQLRAWLELRGLDQAPGFIFLNLGTLAYLGGGEALSQIQLGDFPLFSYFGSVAFLLWRSVYLVKQVATRNRVLVTIDWMKDFVFGRDMTRF